MGLHRFGGNHTLPRAFLDFISSFAFLSPRVSIEDLVYDHACASAQPLI